MPVTPPVVIYAVRRGQVMDVRRDGSTSPWPKIATDKLDAGLLEVSRSIRRLQVKGLVITEPRVRPCKRFVEVGQYPANLVMVYTIKSLRRVGVEVFQRPSSLAVNETPSARAAIAAIRAEIGGMEPDLSAVPTLPDVHDPGSAKAELI